MLIGEITSITTNSALQHYIRDTVKDIAEQLGPTSLMAWQNRMALDMLLAEKGVVCKIFGLTSLSTELAENSEINDPFAGMMVKWFGRWSGLDASVLLSLFVVAAILVPCGCCCIPCLKGLFQRLIKTTLARTMYQQVESDDDDELHEDDGDKDADDV